MKKDFARSVATKQSPKNNRNANNQTCISLTKNHERLLRFARKIPVPIMLESGYVYIATNKNNTVLYAGVTSDLKDRMESHKNKKYKNSFSARYNVNKLVYYEETGSLDAAHKREKQIKAGSRKKKIDMINSINPDWKDLYDML